MSEIDIVFKQSHVDCLLSYKNLYKTCFPKAHHLTGTYLKWLYQENPSGSFIGADAYCDNELVGQVAAIPGEYFLNGKSARGLLAVNVAVHPRFQGRFLFKKLGLKMCEYGAENGYEFVVGVANRKSTPMFIRQMGFQLVQPLEARLGFGALHLDLDAIATTEQFRHLWSDETFAWRLANPNNRIITRKIADRLQCYAAAKGNVLPVYAELPKQSLSNLEGNRLNLFSPFRLFLGLIPQSSYKFTRYMEVPQRFRPSPLNLIYKSLNHRVEKLEKDYISFSFLDFDAY